MNKYRQAMLEAIRLRNEGKTAKEIKDAVDLIMKG